MKHGGVFVVIGTITLLFGLLADLISVNRQLLEMTLEQTRRIAAEQKREGAPVAETSEPPSVGERQG